MAGTGAVVGGLVSPQRTAYTNHAGLFAPDRTFSFFEVIDMQLLCVLSLFVALVPGQQPPTTKAPAKTPATAKPAAGAARTIELTGGDDMKFNLTKIQAKPGETLRVVLKNVGTIPKIAMGHNFVVLTLAADPAEFNKASMTAAATEYVPQDLKAQIVGATKLSGPGETVEVTFKVPAKAGTYTYMCTFPGHFAAGMKGQLVVQ
jgi:azurin